LHAAFNLGLRVVIIRAVDGFELAAINGNHGISKQIQTNYVDDKEDGVWNQWYENGQLKLEAHYQAGQEHGMFTQWYENGQKRLEANFIHGKKDGVEYAWAKDGSIKSTTTYKDGQVLAE